MTLDEPHAGIPPQPRIVIPVLAERLSAFEVLHRFGQPLVDTGAGRGAGPGELGLGVTLGDETAQDSRSYSEVSPARTSRAALWVPAA